MGVPAVVGVLMAAMCIAGISLREQQSSQENLFFSKTIEQTPLPGTAIEDPKAYVLVEWDAEIDIDLCVYNEQRGRKNTSMREASMKKQTALFLLLALLINAASFCTGRKQAQGQVQEPFGAIVPLKIIYYAGEKQTQELIIADDLWKQEESVDSYQEIDLGTKSLRISNVKLVKEVDMENIHIEYPYLNYAWDEPSRKINEQIYNSIIYYGEAKENLTDNDGCRTDADISYQITYVDDNIISILFSGWIVDGVLSRHNNVDVGLNFNLQSGEILSLADFYELEEIRNLVQNAMLEKRLTSENLILDGEQREIYFNDFLSEFDTDDYINRTDNFFIKDGSICFIAYPPPSFKEWVYIELEVEELGAEK